MKYKDEIKIGIITACFCCAMVTVYAAVPKDASVLRARATSTFKEAPETAAEAEAEKQSEAEDAGFTIYSEDSNYDYDTSDDTGSYDTSDTDSSQDDSGNSDSSYDDNSSGDYANEDNTDNDYNTSDQITYPTDDGSGSSYDDSSSGDTQTDYDTGGSDSSSDSGMFEENLVQEETFYSALLKSNLQEIQKAADTMNNYYVHHLCRLFVFYNIFMLSGSKTASSLANNSATALSYTAHFSLFLIFFIYFLLFANSGPI